MPTILVTNDDGIHSPGLLALKHALLRLANVVVLAPERNWSASSHAKTMHKPLRVTKTTLADGSPAYTSSGSPTDCVALAMGGVLGVRPDLVVSGINAGHNLAVDVTYSGTVACAMEAVIKGVPGIAVSTVQPGQTQEEITLVREMTAEFACSVAEQVLTEGLPPYTLLNLNTPGLSPAAVKGVRVTRMGRRYYDVNEILERQDPYGYPYYWLGGAQPEDEDDPETDVGAIRHGYASVTPISLDMTNHAFVPQLSTWQLALSRAIHGL